MLTTKTPEFSKTTLLDNMLGCNDYYARLFSNNLDENNPNFIEANFSGYSQITLYKNLWQDSIVESEKVVSYYGSPVIWHSTSVSSVVFGYYIVDSSGAALWYQKFPSILAIPKNKAISVTIRAILGCSSS